MDEEKKELGVNVYVKATDNIPESEYFIISGKTLRRNYIYKQRDDYMLETKLVPDEEMMEKFASIARSKFVEVGDYSFNKSTGEASYLGIF